MTVIENTRALSLVDPDGIVIDIDLSPVSVETAGARLPQIQRAIKILRDHQTFLERVIVDSFAEGQIEKRIGDALYEYKPEAEWLVAPEHIEDMATLLALALDTNQITDDEYQKAIKVQRVVTFNHSALNVLAKRLPILNELRTRVQGAAKLRKK